MVTVVNLLQLAKHHILKLVTDDGMVTVVNLLQLEYLLSVDYQCYTL